MLSGYTIKFSHMALGLIPKIFNTVDMIFLVSKQLRVVDSIVPEVVYIQRIISRPTIRVNNAIRNDFALDNRDKRGRRCIRDNLRIHTATAL